MVSYVKDRIGSLKSNGNTKLNASRCVSMPAASCVAPGGLCTVCSSLSAR